MTSTPTSARASLAAPSHFLRLLVALVLAPAGMAACGSADAQAEAASLAADGPSHAALGANEACDFTGTWALKFEIPVSWPANAGVQAGTGTIVQWAISRRTLVDDHHLTEQILPCGSTVPPNHASIGGESYGVSFPDALFDDSDLYAISGRTWLSGTAPGSTFASDPITIELGVHLPQADTAAWPKKAAQLTEHLVDSDHDGNPGITVQARVDDGLKQPPVNMMRTSRAKEFYIALRNVMGAQGRVVSCDRFEGSTLIPNLGGKPALSSSVVGCRLTTGELCNSTQAGLPNRFAPAYRVGDASRSIMVRLGEHATCAQVRALAF